MRVMFINLNIYIIQGDTIKAGIKIHLVNKKLILTKSLQ
jgi:hypothetical protein